MNKEELKNVIIFVVLCILIIFLLTFNVIKNIKKDNVERKVTLINGISDNQVLSMGQDLFFDTMSLFMKDGFTFEVKNNKNKIYNINGKDYYKITNYSIISTKLKEKEIDKFNKYLNILFKDNNYYLLIKKIDTNYIGSNIVIDNYNDSNVIFKSINYYCDNHKYIGEVSNNIDCNYQKKESYFTTTFNDNNLLIDNIEELINIIK